MFNAINTFTGCVYNISYTTTTILLFITSRVILLLQKSFFFFFINLSTVTEVILARRSFVVNIVSIVCNGHTTREMHLNCMLLL